MANFDLVLPYDERMEVWLRERRYPFPRATPHNRIPTKQEIIDAIESTGTHEVECAGERDFFAVRKGAVGRGYEIRIGCSNWKRLGASATDSFTMHGGFFKTELVVLEILPHKCGQLLLYPDTGSPAVIIQPGMDVERTDRIWHEAHQEDDSWTYFYENMGYPPSHSSKNRRR
jgi:hypothetical protein